MIYNNFICLLFIYFINFTVCRSLDSEIDDGSIEEPDYEEIAGEGDEANEEDDANAKVAIAENVEDNESELHNGRLIDFRGNTYLQRVAEERSARANQDRNIPGKKYQSREVSEEKIDDSLDTLKDMVQPHFKMGMINKYINKISGIKDEQKNTIRDNNSMKNNENSLINSRFVNTRKSVSKENYNPYVNNNKKQNDYDKIIEESKSPYKVEHGVNTNNNDEFNYRSRRDIRDKNQQDISKTNEDESIIKKHLKRLSNDELNDLLKSLSDSKRDLLKKIIENNGNSVEANVNKRDITKKAGAVEDNNINENSQESYRVESETVKENLKASTSERLLVKKDTSIQEENENHPSSTNDQTTSPVEISTDTYGGKDKPTNQSKRKRDAYDSSAEFDAYSCPDAEEYSSFADYDSDVHSDNKNKREAPSDDENKITDTMRSLEESFPKINAYDSNVDNALIRVKRTNDVNKRSAALIPDDKASYFPYRAENDDQDNDESSEFDNDGFFDRTSNLAKNKDTESNLNENINSENNVAIGSDTDNILSNVEGIDENIMFNNGVRSRRSSFPVIDFNENYAGSADSSQ